MLSEYMNIVFLAGGLYLHNVVMSSCLFQLMDITKRHVHAFQLYFKYDSYQIQSLHEDCI